MAEKDIKKEHSPGVLKRMKHLKQYSDKDEEGKGSELVVKEDKLPAIPDKFQEIAHLVPFTMRTVLNENELNLYLTEVHEWVSAHPDWDMKEDIDDINGIALEKVVQYRLLAQKKKKKTLDVEKDFHSSVYRTQQFRQNLAARRSDRISNKGGQGSVTNIAIIAGQLDDNKMMELKTRHLDKSKEEDELFPVIDINKQGD